MRLRVWTALTLFVAATTTAAAQRGASDGQWRSLAGEPASTKYAPLDQIPLDNVSRLRISWRKPGIDTSLRRQMPAGRTFAGDFRSTPLMVRGRAFDPDTQMLYVPSITAPFVADILKGDPARTNFNYIPGVRAYPPGPQGLPLLKPPYGRRITAIDLKTGEIRWQVAHGDGPRDHPLLKPLNLPPLGNPGRGGILATKTLLFIGEGDFAMVRAGARLRPDMPMSIAPGAGGKKFRAMDKATGAVVWETELPAGTTGAPITYMHQGRQFIVVAVGGLEHEPEFVALSLP